MTFFIDIISVKTVKILFDSCQIYSESCNYKILLKKLFYNLIGVQLQQNKKYIVLIIWEQQERIIMRASILILFPRNIKNCFYILTDPKQNIWPVSKCLNLNSNLWNNYEKANLPHKHFINANTSTFSYQTHCCIHSAEIKNWEWLWDAMIFFSIVTTHRFSIPYNLPRSF